MVVLQNFMIKSEYYSFHAIVRDTQLLTKLCFDNTHAPTQRYQCPQPTNEPTNTYTHTHAWIAQLAGGVEYTDYFSAEG